MVPPARTWSLRTLVAAVATLLVVAGAGWSTPARAADPLTDQVTVVMAVPAGGTQDSTTLQQVVDAVNGPVAGYWNEQSGGSIRIGVTGQLDWYQSSYDCQHNSALWADAAQRSGWSTGPGKHLLVYVPQGSPNCGLGMSQRGNIGDPTELLISTLSTSVIAQGFGSGFGLSDSSAYQCDGAVDAGTCQTVTKGDYYDPMGHSWAQLGSLDVVQAAKIGLLPAAAQRTVNFTDATTTVALAPVSGTTGVRAVRMVAPGGWVYWLEYRPASGQDAWLGTAADTRGLAPGVLLRLSKDSSPDSLLLDPTPPAHWAGSADTDVAMPIGSPVPVNWGSFTITVTATSGTDATVQIATDPALRTWTTATNRLPSGNLEVASSSGTTLTVRGWTFDPDQPTRPVTVQVYVDGGTIPAVVADEPRSDVAAAFPQAGGAHGFSTTANLVPGVHTVCVDAWDPQMPYTGTELGCRTVPVAVTLPQGHWDSVSAVGTTLSLYGWAFDPDSPAAADTVHVYVDGKWGTALTADQSRADVGRAFPSAGAAHGYSWTTTLTPGTHSVCLFAIDEQVPSTHTDLGCRQVPVAVTLPQGHWDSASTTGTSLSLWGWAFDPDSPAAADTVHVYVDGKWGTALTADQSRADVGRAFPSAGAAHGYSWTTTLTPGTHSVCLFAIDEQVPSTHTDLGCRTVTATATH